MDIKRSKIMKRKNGGYSAYIWGEDIPRKYVYAPTAAECRIKLEELAEKTKFGVVDSSITFEGLAQNWLDIRKEMLSPSTIRSYAQYLNSYIPEDFNSKKVTNINNSDIQKIMKDFAKDHSEKSQKNLLGIIHSIFEYGILNHIIIVNPCRNILIKRTPAYQYHIYTPEEMSKLIDIFRGSADLIPVMLAAFCGMRLSEIMGLKWSDIDFKDKKITISRVALSIGRKAEIKDIPKTRTSQRTIPVPEAVMKELRKQKSTGYVYGGEEPTCGFTFSERFKYQLEKNGLPPTRFHDLRHFSATTLMDAGLPDKVISEYLGHSNTNITKKYEHIRKNTERRAANAMDEVFSSISGVNSGVNNKEENKKAP